MKTVGTEEHFVSDALLAAWRQSDPGGAAPDPRLAEAGHQRVAAMDEAGLDVQVISVPPPGLHGLSGPDAAVLQSDTNDVIADIVASRPDRFEGFATLAMHDPGAAAHELARAVDHGLSGAMLLGRQGERNLDSVENWVVFEAAEALRAPLYIHPQLPQPAVRAAMYSGFGTEVDAAFASYGIGWHYEAGVQFLRLGLAGVFERFPDLQVILGHWGEMVVFYLERIDALALQAGLPCAFSEYVRRNVHVTVGGVFSYRYLRWAAEVVGAERILFATDYPNQPTPVAGVAGWLAASGLDDADQVRVASGNWEALRDAIRR